MLDAYIIERIRREQERARQQDGRLPLHIDPPRSPTVPEPPQPSREDDQERGSVVIDFQI